MANIVRITKDDDGEEYTDNYWHLISPIGDGVFAEVFCTQEVYGFGESAVEYIEKQGKINCPKCIQKVKAIKKIRL